MSVLDSMEALLASCNDVLPSTLKAAQDDLKYLRLAEQRAKNWRRAELLQIVCALSGPDYPTTDRDRGGSEEKIDRWAREKVAVAQAILKALDAATDEERAK